MGTRTANSVPSNDRDAGFLSASAVFNHSFINAGKSIVSLQIAALWSRTGTLLVIALFRAQEGYPAMNTISATNTSANSAIASLIKDAASSGSALASQGSASSSSSAPSVSSADPTDTVDLSDRAKQILARAKSEQAAADKLNTLLQSLNNPEGKDATSKPKSGDGTALFDKLSGRSQSQSSSDTQWVAGSKYGDPTISDAAFIDKYKDALLGGLAGAPPEKLAALQAAINNGTLKIQKGSDVPGYNNRTVVTYSGSPGGLQGMSTSPYVAPTGAAKDAIQAGNAYGFWTEDRGDVYVTW